MELLNLLTNKHKSKVFHLEAIQDEKIYIGTDIKANSVEEANTIFKMCFFDKIDLETKIYCIQEEWLN